MCLMIRGVRIERKNQSESGQGKEVKKGILHGPELDRNLWARLACKLLNLDHIFNISWKIGKRRQQIWAPICAPR